MNVNYNNNSEITHEEYMDVAGAGSGEWRAGDSCVVAEDSTYVRSYDLTKKSIRITGSSGGTSGYARCDLAATHDLTDSEVIVSYYLDSSQIGDLNSLQLYVAASTSSAHGFFMTVSDFSYGFGKKAGWHEVRLPLAPKTYNSNVSTWLSSINQVRLKITKGSTSTGWVVIDSVRFVKKRTKPSYILTYDDGKTQDLVVARYLASKGLKGSFCISTDRVGNTGSGYMTLSELQEIKALGHLIFNHSYDHEYLNTDDLGFTEAVESINKATEWLIDNGFERGARIWATPGGSSEYYGWDKEAKDLVAYCDMIRTTASSNAIATYDGSTVLETSNFIDTFADIVESEAWFNANAREAGCVFSEGCHTWAVDTTPVVVSGGELTTEYKNHIDWLANLVNTGEVLNPTLDDIVYDEESIPFSGRGRFTGSGRFI